MYAFTASPWWFLVPLLVGLCFLVSKSIKIAGLVAGFLAFFLFTDHYTCHGNSGHYFRLYRDLCVAGYTGIYMSKSDRAQRAITPILDMLQTLPTFVYLIPLIFLFKITEPKLYGLAIIMYAIVPVVRLTNLGIRLVDQSVIEAANAYGLTSRQKLVGVEIPLALPNIMAGVN